MVQRYKYFAREALCIVLLFFLFVISTCKCVSHIFLFVSQPFYARAYNRTKTRYYKCYQRDYHPCFQQVTGASSSLKSATESATGAENEGTDPKMAATYFHTALTFSKKSPPFLKKSTPF